MYSHTWGVQCPATQKCAVPSHTWGVLCPATQGCGVHGHTAVCSAHPHSGVLCQATQGCAVHGHTAVCGVHQHDRQWAVLGHTAGAACRNTTVVYRAQPHRECAVHGSHRKCEVHHAGVCRAHPRKPGCVRHGHRQRLAVCTNTAVGRVQQRREPSRDVPLRATPRGWCRPRPHRGSPSAATQKGCSARPHTRVLCHAATQWNCQVLCAGTQRARKAQPPSAAVVWHTQPHSEGAVHNHRGWSVQLHRAWVVDSHTETCRVTENRGISGAPHSTRRGVVCRHEAQVKPRTVQPQKQEHGEPATTDV